VVRLFLQPVGQPLREALDQRVELARHLADHVARLVVRLERRAPDHPPVCLSKVAEIFHETGDEVGLGEERVDREVDLQAVVQLQ
jgi:hypothetical protein